MHIDPDDDLDFLAPDEEEDDDQGTPPTPTPPPAPPAPAPPAPPATPPTQAPAAAAPTPESDEFDDDPYAQRIRDAAEKRAQKLAQEQMGAVYEMVAPMVQQNAINRIVEEGNVPKAAVPYLREIVSDIPAHLLAGIDAKTVKTFAAAAIGRAYTEKRIVDDEPEFVPVAPTGSSGGATALTASQKQYAKEYFETSGVKPTKKQLLEWGIQ